MRSPTTRPTASRGSSGRASIGSSSISSRRACPSSSTSSTLTTCAGSLAPCARGGHASRAALWPSAAHVCGARAWQGDLVALLASVSGQDAHADAFLARLLSLSDYSYFCEQMRAGGGALRGSAEDEL